MKDNMSSPAHPTGPLYQSLHRSSSGTRLMLSEPIPGGPNPFWESFQKTVNTVARQGTTIDYVTLRKGYSDSTSPYTSFYNARGQVERAYEAEKNGYDAFMIGCAFDPGLKECRSVVNIPVVAPLESAALIACTLGNRFSVISLDPGWVQITINTLYSYGLRDKLASVRCPRGLTFHEAFEKMFSGEQGQQKVVDLLIEEMSKAVLEDSTEVLLVGCLIGSSVLAMHQVCQVDGVPVIDPLAAQIKMAETLSDFQKAYGTGVCRASIYRSPHKGWEKEIPIDAD